MRGLINDGLRRLIGLGIVRLGMVLAVVHRIKVSTFTRNQKRLRRQYRITSETPVLTFGPEIEQLIQNAATRAGRGVRFALTSGSTANPKRLLYPNHRLRAVKLAYVDVFARCCRARHIERTSLYVFSSFSKDHSLTSMLLDEMSLPVYLATLQAPYRVQCHPAIRSLVSAYGATAVRLWMLAVANPGVLYSTNPSTLSTFLDEMADRWQRSSGLIRDWCRKPEAFDRTLHLIAGRLASRGGTARLRRIAESDAPLPLQLCAPAVEAYVCWAGGYVKPFLDRIANHLPPERYRFIPMYSMSTETIETVSHFDGDAVSFLPLASGVLYEFIEESAENRPENLRTADQLEAGKTYSMVVSDPYGLRRYQTGDLFLCRGFIAGLPDLHFVRRRDLAYSFTGEKVTSEQVSTAFQRLREEYPWLGADKFLTCVPSQPADEPVPHYKIVLVGGARGGDVEISGDELAVRCDVLLGEMNSEYRSKRESGRLGRAMFMRVPPGDFIEQISGSRQSYSMEAQFKFLPLYQRTWESLERPNAALPGVTARAPCEICSVAK